MSNLEMIKIKDLCEKISVGFVGTTSPFYTSKEEGIPILRSKNVRLGRIDMNDLAYITKEFHEKNKKSQLQKGDIVIVRVGQNRGDVCKISNEFEQLNVANCVFIRPFKKYSDYIEILLRSNYGQKLLLSISTGSAQEVLNTGAIAEIEIPILNEEMLLYSSKTINAFDDKIELLQAQNKTLETMAQTIFKEWFGKYQIGDELPEGWRVGKLEDLFGELESGNRPKGGVGSLSEGIPSIGAESIGGISNFDYSKTKYVSKEFFLKMKRGIVKEYDILVYKDGGTPGTFIPKFSMFGEGFPFKEFCINSHVFRVQPKKDVFRFYIYQWLNSYYCKWQLKNIGGKAAIPGINSTDFKSLEVIIPVEQLVSEYHNLVKNKYKKILKNMVQIQSLTKTRDTLLPKLMSGKVRVKNIKESVYA